MNLRNFLAALALSATGLLAGAAGAAELTLFERPHFGGERLTLAGTTPNVDHRNFNDRASSIVVRSGRWLVCTDADFRGRCMELAPGDYAVLDPAFNDRISSVREVDRHGRRGEPRHDERGIIKFFARPSFGGRSLDLQEDTPDFTLRRYNDRASSIIVSEGVWELCADVGYAGRCRRFGPGRYEDLGPLSRQVSSARFLPGARPGSREYRDDVVVHPAPLPPRARHEGRLPPRGGGDSRLTLFFFAGLQDPSYTLSESTPDLQAVPFNDAAASLKVEGGRWLVCSDAHFRGHCEVLEPGVYDNLTALGLNKAISSARPAGR